MTATFFPQNNWEPFLYHHLNQRIADAQHQDTSYTVFDFDNTTVLMDIEDNLMVYTLETLAYVLDPAGFQQLLLGGAFDYDELIIPDQPTTTVSNVAWDIVDAYTQLYDAYLYQAPQDRTAEQLAQIQQTDAYADFVAKYRAFYLYTNGHWMREPGQPWVNYYFAGMTRAELHQHSQAMFEVMTTRPFTQITYRSATTGRSGIIQSSFASGLRLPQELADLHYALEANDITTYIVSASPIDLVRAAVDYWQLPIPDQRLFAMEYTIDAQARIQSLMAPEGYITKGTGKTAVIKEQLQPRHHLADPLMVFGDSMGDYDMMHAFGKQTDRILFNRLLDDPTQVIVNLAVDQYDQADANFFLQGRDDNQGCLRPSQATIAYGETEPRISAR